MTSPSFETQIAAIKTWLGTGSVNVFGMPLAGKDTQSHRLAKHLDGPVLSGGDILRNSQEIPADVRQIFEEGNLTPTDFFLKIVMPYLGRKEFEGRPLILSSVGRWDGEQEHVIKAADEAGHPVKVVVLLNLDESVARERWLRHIKEGSNRGVRPDDAEEAQQLRFEEFRTKTTPVIAFYRHRNQLIEVDGDGTPDEVEARVINALYQFVQNN